MVSGKSIHDSRVHDVLHIAEQFVRFGMEWFPMRAVNVSFMFLVRLLMERAFPAFPLVLAGNTDNRSVLQRQPFYLTVEVGGHHSFMLIFRDDAWTEFLVPDDVPPLFRVGIGKSFPSSRALEPSLPVR